MIWRFWPGSKRSARSQSFDQAVQVLEQDSRVRLYSGYSDQQTACLLLCDTDITGAQQQWLQQLADRIGAPLVFPAQRGDWPALAIAIETALYQQQNWPLVIIDFDPRPAQAPALEKPCFYLASGDSDLLANALLFQLSGLLAPSQVHYSLHSNHPLLTGDCVKGRHSLAWGFCTSSYLTDQGCEQLSMALTQALKAVYQGRQIM